MQSSLPLWSHTLFPNNEKFYKAALKVFYMSTATKHLAKFSGGFLLKDLLERFTSKAQQSLDPDRKFFIYSTHDFNLFNLLISLDIFDVRQKWTNVLCNGQLTESILCFRINSFRILQPLSLNWWITRTSTTCRYFIKIPTNRRIQFIFLVVAFHVR